MRLLRVGLDAGNQVALVVGADLDAATTSHNFPHLLLLSSGDRIVFAIVERWSCVRLAVALQHCSAVFRPLGPGVDRQPMPPLRLYVCGRLAVEHAGVVLRETDFPARQGRRLWAYLVLRRRWPVGRDDLAGAVWGDAIPDAWDATLNALVSRLRAVLRPIAAATPGLGIRGEVGRYALTLPPDAVVDVERARAGVHLAETALRRGDCALTLSEAQVAMEIAARGFLDGEEGPWIEGQRRALIDLRLHALEYTVEAELLRGNAAIAEREAEQLLLLDSLRESGYRLLMRALAAGGNPAQAIRVMEDCRRTLRVEAGLAPSAETERVFQALVPTPPSGSSQTHG
jgi:DNA-binding SARP family transcriptional activator